MEYADGFYYLYTPVEPEPVLVRHYYSSDMQCNVFGFNVHDGGGILPVWDLTDETTVVPVTINEEE